MAPKKIKGNAVVSAFDKKCYLTIRRNIRKFLVEGSSRYDKRGALVLDIAPQEHNEVPGYFRKAVIETLDIDPRSGATYIADITRTNRSIKGGRFDVIICTEVLEHTLDPFAAVKEIRRLLAPRGVLLISVPFNFRIHGPLPDCWRFTEHGIRALLKDFSRKEIRPVPTPGRDLMPMHYTVVAQK